METEPAPIRFGDTLSFAEEGHKQQEDQVGVDLGLELEIARKIFRGNFALAAFELEGGVQGVIELFNKDDQRPNVEIAQTGTRVMFFQLLDQPARIINPDVELVVRAAKKCPGELAQLSSGCAGHAGQLGRAVAIDQ